MQIVLFEQLQKLNYKSIKSTYKIIQFYVRRYVVTHPNITIEILKLLIKDKDSFICFKSAQRLLALINISQNEDDMRYVKISENILKHFSSRFK